MIHQRLFQLILELQERVVCRGVAKINGAFSFRVLRQEILVEHDPYVDITVFPNVDTVAVGALGKDLDLPVFSASNCN